MTPDELEDELTDRFKLPFCGCGSSKQWPYLIGGISLLSELQTVRSALCFRTERDVWKPFYEGWEQRCLDHFGSESGADFFWHWINESPARLAEHGGSVPGWLTDDGVKLRDILWQCKVEDFDLVGPEDLRL